MRARVDKDARRVAVALLAQGEATLAEVAQLAGVSRQTARYWADVAEVDWRRMRRSRLRMKWRWEVRHGPKLVEKSKPRLIKRFSRK